MMKRLLPLILCALAVPALADESAVKQLTDQAPKDSTLAQPIAVPEPKPVPVSDVSPLLSGYYVFDAHKPYKPISLDTFGSIDGKSRRYIRFQRAGAGTDVVVLEYLESSGFFSHHVESARLGYDEARGIVKVTLVGTQFRMELKAYPSKIIVTGELKPDGSIEGEAVISLRKDFQPDQYDEKDRHPVLIKPVTSAKELDMIAPLFNR